MSVIESPILISEMTLTNSSMFTLFDELMSKIYKKNLNQNYFTLNCLWNSSSPFAPVGLKKSCSFSI